MFYPSEIRTTLSDTENLSVNLLVEVRTCSCATLITNLAYKQFRYRRFITDSRAIIAYKYTWNRECNA